MNLPLSNWKKLISLCARLGTGLLLLVLVYSCATVPGLREETSGSFIRVPFVRVLLDEGHDSLSLGADGQFVIEALVGDSQQVYYASKPVSVLNENGALWVLDRRGQELAGPLDEVNLISRSAKSNLRYGAKGYRGLFKLLPQGFNVRLINVVYVEDYLRGVVPPEIGKRTQKELEAVKAQAVAARTYAISHLQQYPDEPFDMKASILDQVYEGTQVENRLVDRAIAETAGRVATYEGEFIQAYYHSTCGGMTDEITAVWERGAQPYLIPVSDSGACSWSKYYTWEETFTEAQLRGRMEQYLSADRGRDLRLNRLTDLAIKDRTPGGRVATLLVRTAGESFRFKKDRIRWVVGRSSNPDLILPSDRFDLDIRRGPDGAVERVVFRGRGYGHGVGMCQCGAIGLARDGWDYERILKHYYTGIEITKVY